MPSRRCQRAGGGRSQHPPVDGTLNSRPRLHIQTNMIYSRKAFLPLLTLAAALALAASARAQLAGPRVRAEVTPSVPARATLFPLEDVRLLPGPFKDAQETDRAYMLRLDPDRLLSGMRLAAGLTPKAPTYGGWDSGGAGTVGHYLSAFSQMAQATGDPALPTARGLHRLRNGRLPGGGREWRAVGVALGPGLVRETRPGQRPAHEHDAVVHHPQDPGGPARRLPAAGTRRRGMCWCGWPTGASPSRPG